MFQKTQWIQVWKNSKMKSKRKANEMAGGKGKIHEHPNAGKSTFAKRKQDINRSGLNRKSIASVNLELEKKGYKAANKQDIIDCYLRLINLDMPELTEMIKDKDQPAMIRIVGKAILSGKGFDIIEKMLDRGIGKADSKLTLEGGEKPILQEPVKIVFKKSK